MNQINVLITSIYGASRDIIGKYERGENIPSIDVAAKMAEPLGVTLDYLVKDGEYEQIDNEMLKLLKEVQGLDEEDRVHIFATINAFIKAAKLKSIARVVDIKKLTESEKEQVFALLDIPRQKQDAGDTQIKQQRPIFIGLGVVVLFLFSSRP
ncbi:helix-turn-helix domain-containing protein [Sphingobacterium sp. MYb382]|uniref:helix-turn-helix domain-containing protein n=1 Tax=Sphingobacterium sp. MYb382 TaxID=2745278 RepID=UPI00309F686A